MQSLFVDIRRNGLDALTPAHGRFRLDAKRVARYLTLRRDGEPGSVDGFGPRDIPIPIGKNETIFYGNGDAAEGGVTDRTLHDYQQTLFPKQFHTVPREEVVEQRKRYFAEHGKFKGWTIEDFLKEAEPEKDYRGSDEYQEAFKAGKTVLDVGSGQAIALMQLAQRFPNTTFIGVDHLYHRIPTPDFEKGHPQKEEVWQVFPGRPGLQLSNASWFDLKGIPNHSVDNIIK